MSHNDEVVDLMRENAALTEKLKERDREIRSRIRRLDELERDCGLLRTQLAEVTADRDAQQRRYEVERVAAKLAEVERERDEARADATRLNKVCIWLGKVLHQRGDETAELATSHIKVEAERDAALTEQRRLAGRVDELEIVLRLLLDASDPFATAVDGYDEWKGPVRDASERGWHVLLDLTTPSASQPPEIDKEVEETAS